MSNVSADTANWRLFGGGGLALGGLLLLIGSLIGFTSDLSLIGLVAWLLVLSYLVLAVGSFLVAWGQTGSNGAVGALLWGKVALFVLAAGFLLLFLVYLFGFGFGVLLPAFVSQLAWVAIALGSVASAVAIYQRGVAKGIAKYALFVVALLLVLQAISYFFDVAVLRNEWFSLLLALSLLGTGVVYILNGKFAK